MRMASAPLPAYSSIPRKIISQLPPSHWTTALNEAGRALYSLKRARDAYYEWGGGYPAEHCQPDDYAGKHAVPPKPAEDQEGN
jgi:hypothetical protein